MTNVRVNMTTTASTTIMSEIMLIIKVFKFYDELGITMVGYMKTGQEKGLCQDGIIDGRI